MQRLDEIEHQLDILERRIRALENLRIMLQQPSSEAAQSPTHVGVMQEV